MRFIDIFALTLTDQEIFWIYEFFLLPIQKFPRINFKNVQRKCKFPSHFISVLFKDNETQMQLTFVLWRVFGISIVMFGWIELRLEKTGSQEIEIFLLLMINFYFPEIKCWAGWSNNLLFKYFHALFETSR